MAAGKKEDTMVERHFLLSALWIALMLIYLLGDVLRIFAGDFKAGEMGGEQAQPWMFLVAAAAMLIPIAMLVLSLVLKQPVNRWVNISAAAFLFFFNLVGLPGYVGLYDKALIVVGLGVNLLTIWLAWSWN